MDKYHFLHINCNLPKTTIGQLNHRLLRGSFLHQSSGEIRESFAMAADSQVNHFKQPDWPARSLVE